MDNKKRKIGESAANYGDPKNEAEAPSEPNLGERRKRKIGPVLPPGNQVKDDEPGSESDSDDDFGPTLPPAEAESRLNESQGSYTEPKEFQEVQEEPAPTPPGQSNGGKRDSWILQPPGASDWTSRVDPTKLRNRKFQTGKSAKGPAGGSRQIDSSWTETPQEKMSRLQDQVMGVAAPPASGGQETTAEESKKTEIMRERIQKYNKETRKASQSDRVQKPAKEGKEDDDPSKRAFDREKDMSISSRISNAQRREMVNRASDYGSRFSGGKFL